MQNFIQYAPTEVIFGRGTEAQTGAAAAKWGGSRVLIVYGGGSVVRSGLLKRVEESLEKEGIVYEEFGGVRPNPRLAFAEEGVRKALDFRADMVLAVGGGSAIDTAKGIAHGAANPELKLWDDIWMKRKALTKSLPVGVVLTIAAAGSEMSDSAVLTNEETGRKAGLNTEFNRVKFAVMNPELAFTLPAFQLACGITDIMMHTMERYFISGIKCQLTDEIAEGLLRTVVENGRILMKNKEDYDAMAEIMWCSSISHNNLTEAGRGQRFFRAQAGPCAERPVRRGAWGQPGCCVGFLGQIHVWRSSRPLCPLCPKSLGCGTGGRSGSRIGGHCKNGGIFQIYRHARKSERTGAQAVGGGSESPGAGCDPERFSEAVAD